MKKIFLSISIFVMGLVLVSCKGNTDFKVDVFIYNYADTYIGGVRAELESQLKDVKNLEFQFHDAALSQETQNGQIDAAIAAGTDLLVVNIMEVASADTVVAKAKTANIPVLFFNREVDDSAVKSYADAAFIGTDPDEAGVMQGELAAQILLADYAKFDPENIGVGYVMLRADGTNPEALGRTKYSVEQANKLLVAAGKPVMRQIGATQDANWDTAQAKTAMAGLITAHGVESIGIVFTNNDDMALGAVGALQEEGYNKGDKTKTIPVLGVDVTAPAVEAIEKGEMAGSIKQDGVAMATAVRIFITEIQSGKAFNATGDYTFETGVKKVRIPYAIYTGK